MNSKGFPEVEPPRFGRALVADHHKAPTQPDAWTIVDGKLFLNYNTDVKKIWMEKQSEFIEKANINWPVVQLEKD